MQKKDLKIVFFGTPEFAVESLDALVNGGYNIVGVVTATDKPAGRGHHLLQSDVKRYAIEKGLNILQPERLKDPAFIEQLRALEADLFIVIAFRMLPEAVWKMPRLGTFNLHASLLPKYRGAAPINWALINGDTETGVTTFFLKHEIDTGDIIDRERIEIGPEENVGDIHDRLMHIGARLTVKTVESIIDGTLTTTPQDALLGECEPTPAPKIFRDTCHIDPSRKAADIHNLVRGLSPYPAAWITLPLPDGINIDAKIFKTRILDKKSPEDERATIKISRDGIVIFAEDRQVEVLSLQPAGKRRMNADEFLRGLRL